jgi:predicted glycoside hydrolase/deacetylase ChbG (UPF0249 family)
MRYLIINADGYGFTEGVTRAIEECIEFGTVRSLSANVNFAHAAKLTELVRKYPELSVGCHLNPVVGSPVLPPEKVPTLVDKNGTFLYKQFSRSFLSGQIRLAELRSELMAQIEKISSMVGSAFSHIDFHMGLHRLPGLYKVFLDVVQKSGVRRIRTHRYLVGMESRFPILKHYWYLSVYPARIPKFLWNLWLRRKALRCGLAMPDRRVEITYMGVRANTINVQNYIKMIRNLPKGFSEFVVHPGYVDSDLIRWSSYVDQRVLERQVLLSKKFRDEIYSAGVRLVGYRDIPLR